MRYRSQSHVHTESGLYFVDDLLSNTSSGANAWTVNVVDVESQMWDNPAGGKSVVKPVTHLSYVVDSLQVKASFYHSGDTSNAPDPRLRFRDAPFYSDSLDTYRPSGSLLAAPAYIPVTDTSADDLGKCIFDAYNKFINSVTALDASVSIAESGETPQLFRIWQRRKGLATNLTGGFLNYSFGWKPLLSDLMAIHKELKHFPETVRKRLKAIGDKEVVRHFKFNLSSTINGVNVPGNNQNAPYEWGKYGVEHKSVNKSRTVVVTIRASVKPKLQGGGQDLLNKLGALGLIPSLSTLWSVTRLSFVVDWFYNVGGAIENLQGCLTHDISNVTVCVSDLRSREISVKSESTSGPHSRLVGKVTQRYYARQQSVVPKLPILTYPQRVMPYVLLGLLGLNLTKRGKRVLRALDGSPLSKAISAKINKGLDKLSAFQRAEVLKVVTRR